uniref:Uncharacterized protein n=1 Tax=Amazona collaria TaxID=241587 RepID=A0A8B9IVB6_9PSIT
MPFHLTLFLLFFSFKFRIHLIKDKDVIDDYLAKNIKGLSKQEAAAIKTFYQSDRNSTSSCLQNILLFSFLAQKWTGKPSLKTFKLKSRKLPNLS